MLLQSLLCNYFEVTVRTTLFVYTNIHVNITYTHYSMHYSDLEALAEQDDEGGDGEVEVHLPLLRLLS